MHSSPSETNSRSSCHEITSFMTSEGLLPPVRELLCALWLVGTLFNDAFSVIRLYNVGDKVTREWLILEDLVWSGGSLFLRYYTGIRLEGLRKAIKTLNQNRRWPGPRFEPGKSLIWSRSVNYSTKMLRIFLYGIWVFAQ
jgi:hypothetical protein